MSTDYVRGVEDVHYRMVELPNGRKRQVFWAVSFVTTRHVKLLSVGINDGMQVFSPVSFSI